MSGIAGIVEGDGRTVSTTALERIAAAAAFRGRDGTAIWHDGPVGLIRFRHATTPEAVRECQPRRAESGGTIVFDGRIDNRAEVLALLGARGMALRDRPDDELAMALFEARGGDFLKRLAGDYALAIWEPEAQRLFCARSPAGWRAFLYTFDGRRFAFASETRALVVGLGLERKLNGPAIAEFLAGRIVTPEDSFFAGVHRLPQGAALVYRSGHVRCWHWDDLPFEDLTRLSEGEHIERFNALFDQALIACSRSNTGVAAQLSGGLDSSSILCRATELARAGRIERPATAITARFPGSPADESAWSGAVEHHLGIKARVVHGGRFDPHAAHAWSAATLQLPLRPNTLDTVEGIVRDLDRHGERVLLSGDGGDEFLNGNHGHWPDELRRGRVDLIAREALAMPGASPISAMRAMVMESVAPFVSRTRFQRTAWRRWWSGQPMPDWLCPEWLARTGVTERLADARPARTFGSLAAQNRYAVIEFPARDAVIGPTQDYARLHGVDYRHPFHDRGLQYFYMGASGAILFKRGLRKHVLREAMRETLPEAVRTRTNKAHFNTVTLDGLAIYYASRPIREQWPVKLGWVDGGRLERIWHEHRDWYAEGAIGPAPPLTFGALWNTAALDIWLESGFGM